MTTSDARKRNDPEVGCHVCGWVGPIMEAHDCRPRSERTLEAILSEVRALREALTSTETARPTTETPADAEQAPTEGQGADGASGAILGEPPIGSRVVDRDDDVWERRDDGWVDWAPESRTWGYVFEFEEVRTRYAPLRLATPADLARVGIEDEREQGDRCNSWRHDDETGECADCLATELKAERDAARAELDALRGRIVLRLGMYDAYALLTDDTDQEGKR